MNPIVNQLNQNNPMVAMLQPLYNAMRGTQNPMAALGQMAIGDERMQQVIDTIRQNGGIEQAVYAESQRQNVNPNDVLRKAQQMLNAFNMK